MRAWLQLPQRNEERVRRVLTEQLLPADICGKGWPSREDRAVR
jgi:hypothetical protein